MRIAVLLSLVAAIAAEAPYNLPRPAVNAPSFNYPVPIARRPSLPSPQYQPQPAPQPNFGYQYQQPSIAPAFVQPQPQPVYTQPQPAPQPIYSQPQPAPQPQPIYSQPQPVYTQPQPQPIYTQPQSPYYYPVPQPQFQPQPQPRPQLQPSPSYGLPQPQIAPQPIRPLPAYVSPQVYQPQPIQYQQQQQQFSQQGYSYQQPQARVQAQFSSLPLQTGSSAALNSLSSYQADSNQYSGAQAQTHRDALDSTVVSRVQDIIKDSEHSSARSAGYQSLVSGVSLENAQPSIELSSFVQNSRLTSQGSGAQSSSFSSGSGISGPSVDYGLPTITANSQSESSQSGVTNNFLPQTQPASSYGSPN